MRVLVLTAASILLLSAQSRPDFSGVWKLNISSSEFGNAPAPVSMTSRIEHHNPEIRVRSEISGPQGTYTTNYKWITDGRENVNTIRGNEIKAKVVWEGNVLISTATTTAKDITLTLIDRWKLSDGGKVLTIARTIVAPQGNVEQKYVYEKELD